MVKNAISFSSGSDFMDDLSAAVATLPGTMIGWSYRQVRKISSMIGNVLRKASQWVRSDTGQFAMIVILAAIVIGLQLRSLV